MTPGSYTLFSCIRGGSRCCTPGRARSGAVAATQRAGQQSVGPGFFASAAACMGTDRAGFVVERLQGFRLCESPLAALLLPPPKKVAQPSHHGAPPARPSDHPTTVSSRQVHCARGFLLERAELHALNAIRRAHRTSRPARRTPHRSLRTPRRQTQLRALTGRVAFRFEHDAPQRMNPTQPARLHQHKRPTSIDPHTTNVISIGNSTLIPRLRIREHVRIAHLVTSRKKTENGSFRKKRVARRV